MQILYEAVRQCGVEGQARQEGARSSPHQQEDVRVSHLRQVLLQQPVLQTTQETCSSGWPSLPLPCFPPFILDVDILIQLLDIHIWWPADIT